MSRGKSMAPTVVAGTKFSQKLEYTARLSAYYADGTMLTRPIRGGVYQVNLHGYITWLIPKNIEEYCTIVLKFVCPIYAVRFFDLHITFFDEFRPVAGAHARNRGNVEGSRKAPFLWVAGDASTYEANDA